MELTLSRALRLFLMRWYVFQHSFASIAFVSFAAGVVDADEQLAIEALVTDGISFIVTADVDGSACFLFLCMLSLCKRSTSSVKCCSISCERTVMPHTGQHVGSDCFLRWRTARHSSSILLNIKAVRVYGRLPELTSTRMQMKMYHTTANVVEIANGRNRMETLENTILFGNLLQANAHHFPIAVWWRT